MKGTANVFFIDYGNVEEISIYELVQITKKGIVALGETAMHLVKVIFNPIIKLYIPLIVLTGDVGKYQILGGH